MDSLRISIEILPKKLTFLLIFFARSEGFALFHGGIVGNLVEWD